MFTRQHYKSLVDNIQWYYMCTVAKEELLGDLITLFEDDNPAFSSERFTDAIATKEEKDSWGDEELSVEDLLSAAELLAERKAEYRYKAQWLWKKNGHPHHLYQHADGTKVE